MAILTDVIIAMCANVELYETGGIPVMIFKGSKNGMLF